jgi:hypothetical protein
MPARTVGIGPVEYRLAPSTRGYRGTPLVFVHEGLGSITRWQGFPERMRAVLGGPAVLTYARHGHGRSGPLGRATPSMPYEAEAILPALLHAVGFRRPLPTGHSDGASVALLHAAAGFEVAGVVATAPHVFVEEWTIAGIEAAAVAYSVTDLRSRLALRHDDVDGMFAAWLEMWRDHHLSRWDITDRLHAVRALILFVQGDADPYGTASHLDAVQRHAGALFEELDLAGVGHATPRGPRRGRRACSGLRRDDRITSWDDGWQSLTNRKGASRWTAGATRSGTMSQRSTPRTQPSSTRQDRRPSSSSTAAAS